MNHRINVSRTTLFGITVSLHREVSIEKCVANAISKDYRLYKIIGDNSDNPLKLAIINEIVIYIYDASLLKVQGYNIANGVGRVMIYIDLKGDTWLICIENDAGEYVSVFSKYSNIAQVFNSQL